jgi:DNA-binding transcriptional LysR family regulator
LLPPAVRQLMLQAPDVTLKTVVGLVDTLRPQLRAGELDLMIGTESRNEPGLVSQPLAHDHIVVAACAQHELLQRKASIQDLCQYRWVLQPPGAPTRDWLDQAFDRNQLPRPVVQVESTMLLMLPSLIAETGLLSFISRQHLASGESQGKLREIAVKEMTMRRHMVVTHRMNSYLPPAAEWLIRLLQQSAKDAF